MRELAGNELNMIVGGLEKCEMSAETKTQMTIIAIVSPLAAVAAVATYWAVRDC
jgi:hypothetical protein